MRREFFFFLSYLLHKLVFTCFLSVIYVYFYVASYLNILVSPLFLIHGVIINNPHKRVLDPHKKETSMKWTKAPYHC